MEVRFPEDFLFGTATSSHQIEGGNIYNEWYMWERKGKLPECGLACNSWNLYDEDIKLMAKLGYNAYRFSIEWSRVQPKQGAWNDKAIKKYLKVVKALKEYSIEPIVTLHHFTNPAWFFLRKGWEKTENVVFFTEYVEKIVEELVEHVKIWVTINEPSVYAYMGWVSGEYPPFKNNVLLYFRVLRNVLRAHAQAYKIIKRFDINSWIGIAKHFPVFQPAKKYILDQIIVDTADYNFNCIIVEALDKGILPGLFIHRKYKELKGTYDYWGVNYYTRQVLKFNPTRIFTLFAQPLKRVSEEVTDMGWDVYPEGLYNVLMRLKRSGKPIIITENGIATRDDRQRVCFIVRHLYQVWRAMNKGVDVRGYMYWSFIDNYEWVEGFKPRFGLVEVDYESFERKPRESALFYGKLAREKKIDEKYLNACLSKAKKLKMLGSSTCDPSS
ncbi:MAG: beta-glucosidase [Thermofilum sp. ex4484_82]|nr:MAG: beta-glucosidase [Thermofilum sp. ex4484_82]OYT35865.1 MAG: beta-glucosidase [Archaeoglobales archaeon ex4484_92]